MDVITIESKAYHELMGKIEKILRYVEKEEKVEKPRDFDPFGHAGLSPLVTI